MGSSSYSSSDYDARAKDRASTGRATFGHTDDIKSGRKKAEVHKSLNPFEAFRESRDSDAHTVTLPIGIALDTTGSMGRVPVIIQKQLNRLMGLLIDDKLSGKRYLGDAYPAIMISAVDDYRAQVNRGFANGEGSFQVGQFESGLEIEDNLTNIWLTQNGGGTFEESYEIPLWFMGNRTAHDHGEKRGKKGYFFIIGDEHAYPSVSSEQIRSLIGVNLQADVALEDAIAQASLLYHVVFVIPNLSQHYNDAGLERYWNKLLGQQNVIKLEDPNKICEAIAGFIALQEGFAGFDDLKTDGVDSTALVHVKSEVATTTAGAVTKGGKTVRL